MAMVVCLVVVCQGSGTSGMCYVWVVSHADGGSRMWNVRMVSHEGAGMNWSFLNCMGWCHVYTFALVLYIFLLTNNSNKTFLVPVSVCSGSHGSFSGVECGVTEVFLGAFAC